MERCESTFRRSELKVADLRSADGFAGMHALETFQGGRLQILRMGVPTQPFLGQRAGHEHRTEPVGPDHDEAKRAAGAHCYLLTPDERAALRDAFRGSEEAGRRRVGRRTCKKPRKACASLRMPAASSGVLAPARRVTARCSANSTALARMWASRMLHPLGKGRTSGQTRVANFRQASHDVRRQAISRIWVQGRTQLMWCLLPARQFCEEQRPPGREAIHPFGYGPRCKHFGFGALRYGAEATGQADCFGDVCFLVHAAIVQLKVEVSNYPK